MILITGASGFIGQKLLPLIKSKYKRDSIFVLDQKKHDLVSGKGLDKIPGNPKTVFHLAGETDTSKPDQACNDIGVENLINKLKEIGPESHFIFTSSQAIYSGRVNTNRPLEKTTKPAPNNKYGGSKLAAEKILLKASKKQGFKLTIIRLPTTWGNNPRKNSFLNFLKDLVKTNSLFSRLDWPGKLGLLNLDDAIKFILNSSFNAPSKPKIVLIATENLTLAEIFERLTVASGKSYKQIKIPGFIWKTARFLRPYLAYFEGILPADIYNYFWRASIVVDSPLWCKVSVKGKKFTS